MGNPGGAIGALPDRPGSLNQLKKLGDAIRDDDAVAYGSLHYNEVWSWCNDLVAAAVRDISDLDLGRLIPGGTPVSITGRAKIRATVREKLLRRRNERLPSIQDLAGVRVEADMTLTEQDRLVAVIVERFGQGVEAIHDLRDGAHAGYRAVHVWVRLDEPRGAWFEVQVRTRLQGGWANLYEALADAVGRGIRYGEPATDPAREPLVNAIKLLSQHRISALEFIVDAGDRAARGARVSKKRLVSAYMTLGLDVERARREASRSSTPYGRATDDWRGVAVQLLSDGMSELEASVRSLSERKGG